MEPALYENRGYLNEDFRLFYLADSQHKEIEYHYHSFHKIILMIKGNASYAIEGETFELRPGDFVVVGRGCIHRPVVASGEFYERMILYISPEYLQSISSENSNLECCFQLAMENFSYVYHAGRKNHVAELFHVLQKTRSDEGFAADILQKSVFTQLMIEINRTVRKGRNIESNEKDERIVAILQYLNNHLTDEVAIDDLATYFNMSKYHMMRRFREVTGYSIHQYMSEKRLMNAQLYLQQGMSLSDAARECGYKDYSTFSRAFKSKFGYSPSKNVQNENVIS